MNILKAVGTNGEVLTFNIPSEASEIAIGPFFETHIAFHGLRAALMAEAEGKAGPVPLGAHIANLAWTLRHYTEGKNPLELKLTGTSEEEVATMLMGCAEAIANCLARHTPKAPDNEFEFNGRKWYLCQQAVNYKAKQGDGFSVKQVAQGMLLEEYFNNFLEHRLAKEVEKVIEARAAVSASELFMTPTRIFLAQMALFLRTSPDEELPKTQEAFDNWHAARIAQLEQMPLSVAADIRNFFSYLNALRDDPIFANWFTPPRPPHFKEGPDQIKIRAYRERHEEGKGRELAIYGRLWKTGAFQTWEMMLWSPFFDAIQIAIATEYP